MKDTRDMMVKDYDTCTDEELIARLRAGEREITDYLIDKYKSLVRTRARALYLVGGDHEDLIQEGMLGLFKAVRDYKPGKEASFATFAGPVHRPSDVFCSGIVPAPEASAAEQLRLVKRTGFRARAAPGGRGDTGGDHDQPGKRNRHA